MLRYTCRYATIEDNMSSCQSSKRGRIIGMMEAVWLAQQLSHQLGHSDLTLVLRDEFRFNLNSDDNRVCVWRSRRNERFNPAFGLQQQGGNGMVWDGIAYDTRSHLILIHAIIKAQWYVHEILQPHVLPLISGLPRAIFKQDIVRHHNKYTTRLAPPHYHLPRPARFPDLSPIEHNWDNLRRQVVQPTSLVELEARLQLLWNEMSQDTMRRLNVSMPSRIASCIHAGGGPTEY
ncbi:transposable element Tcb2 transposase [Trichonephila clavipes]|nr:transposable element Tcb2 transposase [Trichonephila clavipes]